MIQVKAGRTWSVWQLAQVDLGALWAAGAQDGDTETAWRADVEAALAELADLLVGGE